MSHDQKPGRMRVVTSPAADAQRRRDDDAGAQNTGASAGSAVPTVSITPAVASGKSSKPNRLLAILFVAGCALGGAGLPLLRTL